MPSLHVVIQYNLQTGGKPPGQEERLVPEEESALPEVTNEDSYLHIDDDAPCFADEDSYDDDITEEVVSKRARVEESLAAEDDDEEDSELMVTCSCKVLSAASPVLLC